MRTEGCAGLIVHCQIAANGEIQSSGARDEDKGILERGPRSGAKTRSVATRERERELLAAKLDQLPSDTNRSVRE